MPLYDEIKQSLLNKRAASQQALAERANEISSLAEAVVSEYGFPPEAVSLLNQQGEKAHPDDFGPDAQGYSNFQIEFTISDKDDVLGSFRFAIRGVPAMGAGRIVEVNGRQVKGRVERFDSPEVVDEIKRQIEKLV